MNKDTLLKPESFEAGLQAVHRQWACGAARDFRLLHPELTMTLYGNGWHFTLYVENCEDDAFPALAKYFHDKVRPITCNVRLSQQIPQDSTSIEDKEDYEAELWLNGNPSLLPPLIAYYYSPSQIFQTAVLISTSREISGCSNHPPC